MFSTLKTRVLVSITVLALAQMGGSSACAEDAAKPGASGSSQYSPVVFAAVDKNYKEATTTICGQRVSMVVPANFGILKRVKGTMKTQKKYELLTLSSPAPAGVAPPQIVIMVTEGLNFSNPSALGGNIAPLIATYMFTPPKLADASLGEYPQLFKDFKKSDSSTANLSGTRFGTASFEGRRAILGPNLIHGFTYIAMIKNCTVMVEGLDPGVKPDNLPVLRKAAQSFKIE